MSAALLITLEAWAAKNYGDAAPCNRTLQAWARNARISPRPVKHGRAYFVTPAAVYVPAYSPRRLAERLTHDAAKTQKRA